LKSLGHRKNDRPVVEADRQPAGNEPRQLDFFRGKVFDHQVHPRLPSEPGIEKKVRDGPKLKRHRFQAEFEFQVRFVQLQYRPELRGGGFLAIQGVMLDHVEFNFLVAGFQEAGRKGDSHIAHRGGGLKGYLGQGPIIQKNREPGIAGNEGRGVYIGKVESGLLDLPARGNGDLHPVTSQSPVQLGGLDRSHPGQRQLQLDELLGLRGREEPPG
jgi:hypothetical protein